MDWYVDHKLIDAQVRSVPVDSIESLAFRISLMKGTELWRKMGPRRALLNTRKYTSAARAVALSGVKDLGIGSQ